MNVCRGIGGEKEREKERGWVGKARDRDRTNGENEYLQLTNDGMCVSSMRRKKGTKKEKRSEVE